MHTQKTQLLILEILGDFGPEKTAERFGGGCSIAPCAAQGSDQTASTERLSESWSKLVPYPEWDSNRPQCRCCCKQTWHIGVQWLWILGLCRPNSHINWLGLHLCLSLRESWCSEDTVNGNQTRVVWDAGQDPLTNREQRRTCYSNSGSQ